MWSFKWSLKCSMQKGWRYSTGIEITLFFVLSMHSFNFIYFFRRLYRFINLRWYAFVFPFILVFFLKPLFIVLSSFHSFLLIHFIVMFILCYFLLSINTYFPVSNFVLSLLPYFDPHALPIVANFLLTLLSNRLR